MFNYQDGIVHFVFADNKNYCLPSLAHVPLNQYLYYLLEEEGIQSVWMIQGIGPYDVSAYGKGAVALMRKALTPPAGLLKKIFLAPSDSALKGNESWAEERCSAQQVSQVLKSALCKSSNSAVVVNLPALNTLVQDPECSVLADLIRSLDQCQNRRNILVLLGSTSAVDNTDCLFDQNGAFLRSVDDRFLCPELSSTLMSPISVPLYERLADLITDRFVVLNDMMFSQIRDSIRSMMFQFHDRILDSTETERISTFLYAWLNSAQLRERFPELLNFREGRLRMNFETQISSKQVWDKVIDCADQLIADADRQHLPPTDYLQTKYPVGHRNGASLITVQDPICNLLSNVRLPDEFALEDRQGFSKIQAFYHTEWSRERPKFVTDGMHDVITYMQWGMTNGHDGYVRDCITLVSRYTLDLSVPAPQLEKIFENLTQLLRARKTELVITCQIEDQQLALRRTVAKTDKLRKEILALGERASDALKMEFQTESQSIELQQKIIQRKDLTRTQYHKYAGLLENTIGNLKVETAQVALDAMSHLRDSIQDSDDLLVDLVHASDLSGIDLTLNTDLLDLPDEQTLLASLSETQEQMDPQLVFTEEQCNEALQSLKKQLNHN